MLQYFREEADEEQTGFGRERRSDSQSKGESECRLCILSARVLEWVYCSIKEYQTFCAGVWFGATHPLPRKQV